MQTWIWFHSPASKSKSEKWYILGGWSTSDRNPIHQFFLAASLSWLLDCLIDCLIDWLIDCLLGWLVDWLIDWLTEWVIDWLIDWLIDWSIDWLSDLNKNKVGSTMNSINWTTKFLRQLWPSFIFSNITHRCQTFAWGRVENLIFIIINLMFFFFFADNCLGKLTTPVGAGKLKKKTPQKSPW